MNEQPDYNQPVAYDKDGNPLYAHPPTRTNEDPQPVHFTRAVNPAPPEVSPETSAKREASRKQYPLLNLSDGEYVISAVRRHPIGLVPIIAFISFMLILINGAAIMYINYHNTQAQLGNALPDVVPILLIAVLLSILFLIGGFVAVYVYVHNKFYLTNESVIQEIQVSLFARHEQTVSLANIEDTSFYQDGIIATLFDYGLIRLSTEGDETTYRFTYVSNPKQQIVKLNNAIEAFKNGRPVDSD